MLGSLSSGSAKEILVIFHIVPSQKQHTSSTKKCAQRSRIDGLLVGGADLTVKALGYSYPVECVVRAIWRRLGGSLRVALHCGQI
jgi:hypothetical protein